MITNLAYIAAKRTSVSKHLVESTTTANVEPTALTSLLSAIVDSSDDAIISETLDGNIASWNPGAERIFGYAAAEAIGRSIRLIVPPERHTEQDYVLGKIRLGVKVEHFETTRITEQGRRLDMSISVSPIRNARGMVIGASEIARDITAKKRIERERELARQQLVNAIAGRDDFIADAAHELRNPLNVLMLVWRLLDRVAREHDQSGRVKNLFEKSWGHLERLRASIDRLLDVARVQAGKLDLYREKFDLTELIREVVGRLAVENSAILISLELQACIEGTWDRIRLDQVITNLISNAIKYGSEKPIAVTASAIDDYALLRVQDRGVGISPEDAIRIFDRFGWAGNPSSKRGLGIGLWITKHIVEAHGGTVRVQSEPGAGSTFIVRLPIQPGQGTLD